MQWGAPFWKFLHALAEKVGDRQLTALQKADERRWVIQILNQVGIAMPCKICRKHYSEWKTTHPLKPLEFGDMRANLRRWLYDLHSNVNRQKGVGTQPAFDEVEGLYKSVNLRQALADIPVTGPEMNILRRTAALLFAVWQV